MISFELRIILVFLCSLFSVVFVLPKIANIAKRIGLLDHPNERKMHTKPRPLVGGIGMVIGIIFSSLVFIPMNGLRGYFIGIAILLVVGFLDDFRELGHQHKFMAQILATGAMIYFSKVSLCTFGDLIGLGNICFSEGNILVWIITIFCVVGVTNAVNLIDGLDGLAGGLSFIAFLFFAAHASFAGDHTLMLLNLALAGAVLGFLKFNWHPSVLFMGDAGSLCLGFSLAFMALALTQGIDSTTSPVVPLLILAVPITDTIIVIVKRIMQGKSPFKADKSHLHHIFLRYGMGRDKAVQTILGISIILGGLSLLAPTYALGDTILFSLYAVYFLIYISASFYIVGVFRYTVRLRKKRQHLVRSDLFSRFLFGNFDRLKLFRKAERYNVNIPMCCRTDGTNTTLRGQILNISLTGCMLKMPAFMSNTKLITLSYKMSIGSKLIDFTLTAEHLWSAEHDGAHYHGVRFSEMDDEKKKVLNNYLTHVASQKKQIASKHITA